MALIVGLPTPKRVRLSNGRTFIAKYERPRGSRTGGRIMQRVEEKSQKPLTLFRMGFFGAAHGWGGKKTPVSKICHTYPTLVKLSTVIPYLKNMQRIHESRDTLLDFC